MRIGCLPDERGQVIAGQVDGIAIRVAVVRQQIGGGEGSVLIGGEAGAAVGDGLRGSGGGGEGRRRASSR